MSKPDGMPQFDALLARLIQFLAVNPESRVADSRRIFHGRGRLFPGLEQITLDAFEDILLLTLYQPHSEQVIEDLVVKIELAARPAFSSLIVQHRYAEGVPSQILWRPLPENIRAKRGNLHFSLHLGQQQNTGFFLDMEPGRQWLETVAKDKHVLNLFAYTCAFSVVAIAAGASKVVNVDMSRAALNLGRVNHQINGLDKARSEFLAEDILKSWGRIKRRGPYDIVILDPPTYQKGSFIAEKDYVKLVRRLPELLPDGGQVLACLNAPELAVDFLVDQFNLACPSAVLSTRLIPSADFPDIDPNRQLKLLVFNVPPSELIE